MLFGQAVLRIDEGGPAATNITIRNILLPNPFIEDCRDDDIPGLGRMALFAKFFKSETDGVGDYANIRTADSSEIEVYPVDLSKVTRDAIGYPASGQGYAAKLTIDLRFEPPYNEDIYAANLCQGSERGIRRITEKRLIYGETLDWKTLERFR